MYRNVWKTFSWLMALALLGVAPSSSSFAGTIDSATMFGSEAGTGPGLGTVDVPAIVTLSANNDNVDTGDDEDNNIVVPIKRFDFNGFIDIEFVVDPSQGTTEYLVFESVDNNTGVPWIAYDMYLGFGTGDDFVASAADDGLDFDFDDFDGAPVSSAMPDVDLGQDSLLWSGGLHGSGAENYQFRIDVPDFFEDDVPVVYTFTLRQIPTPLEEPIPEPNTAALALVGGFLVLAWVVRFKQYERVAFVALPRRSDRL